MMTNIVGVEHPVCDLQCGMRGRPRRQDQGESEISLPMCEPVSTGVHDIGTRTSERQRPSQQSRARVGEARAL